MSSQPKRFADRLEDVERCWKMLEACPFGWLQQNPRNIGAIRRLFLRRRLAARGVVPLPAAFCPAIFLCPCGVHGS